MRFNIFAVYLFAIHQATLYCPPINRKRFRREFKRRYLVKKEKIDSKDSLAHSCPGKGTTRLSYSGESQLSWVISHPIEAHRLVKDYLMISDYNIILQLLTVIILCHLLVKSIIHLSVTENDKVLIEYFDSIYYPHLAGLSLQPHMLNYLLLGHFIFFLLGKFIRFRSVIKYSLSNANEYRKLRIAQINSAYLSTFYLTLNEWCSLVKYINKHENCFYSNREINLKHLKFNNLVQKYLPSLTNRDAVFYVNLIDFDECYKDSSLPNYNIRTKYFNKWHVAFPIERISLDALQEIILVASIGSCFIAFGFCTSLFGIIYLLLRSEFPENYSPSIWELLSVIPSCLLSLLHWIRAFESTLVVLCQVLNIYDVVVAYVDYHTITSRTTKMIKVFENHLEIIQHQATSIITQKSESELQQIDINCPTDLGLYLYTSHGSHSEFNEQIRHDITLVRFIYQEFLNAKRFHTDFFNLFVLGETLCISYLIPVLISHPISAEFCILTALLTSCAIPTVAIFLCCARMERTVSLLNN